MLKTRNVVLAALAAAVVAVGGYFFVGPGSGDGYSTVTPGDSGYSQGAY